MACWVTPNEHPPFLFPSAAIALGPKPIPPLKALGAWEASSLNSSSRLQSAASGLRTSLQEARVGGQGALCVLVRAVCVQGYFACLPYRRGSVASGFQDWEVSGSQLPSTASLLDGPLVSACVLWE